jgi:Gluconate 2-dehydrogenase subunit 3
MNRRSAFKNLAVGFGGLIMLPLWMESCGVSDSKMHPTSFSMEEQEILAGLVDSIIPAGNSVGALSVGVDKFLQKLIDDCYEKPVQDNVKRQLHALQVSSRETYGKSFSVCNQQQKENLFMKFSASHDKDQKDFFELIKTETIRGFNTSQKVMEVYLGYKIAPGHYFGCVSVKA